MRTALVALVALPLIAAASSATPVGALDDGEQAAIEALARYDEPTARHAAEAVTEADVFYDVVEQQQRSRERFQQLLAPYPRDVQEQLFEVTRYPELITRIVAGGPKSRDELQTIVAAYPEETRAAALAAANSHWKLLARIDVLLRDETAWLEARVAELPDVKREAYQALVATPELLALLAENTALAVLLGDAYEREPEAVIAWLADVRQAAEQRHTEEARGFAQAMESDSDLASEFEAATSSYEQETGHSAYPPTVVYVTGFELRPYSYWVGFPWWYDLRYGHYPRWYYWYPRPHWALGGLYFGPRPLLAFGAPHGGFWGWYFQRPFHQHRYPRVTRQVLEHDQYRYPRHRHGYRSTRHHALHQQTTTSAVHRFRSDGRRSSDAARERGERPPGARPRAGTLADALEAAAAPQREVKAERWKQRPEPRRAESRQLSHRKQWVRERSAKPKPRRFEKKRRNATEKFDATSRGWRRPSS
jgi:hypothetical protein